MKIEGGEAAGDEMRRWGRGGGGVGASVRGVLERALTFINVDRNLLAEKCCAITT